jgi:hypothetical protein
VRLAVAKPDIRVEDPSSKSSVLTLVTSPFTRWAEAYGYNITPAVAQSDLRTYADRDTQAAYEAWNAGAANVARMVTESTLETEVLREKLLAIAVSG